MIVATEVYSHQKPAAADITAAHQLHQTLLLQKRSYCLNISAFCREAIAEKLERLDAVK